MEQRMNQEQLQAKIKKVEQIITSFLPLEEGNQKIVLSAMNYSVNVGGKRLRPLLMKEAFQMFGGEGKSIEPFMAALEMIHTYSLVHDDLPAMDNDDFRRGKATCHKVYGEAMAILAGDGLLNYAFETACRAFDGETSGKREQQALKILASKAGIFGMIGGQTADIQAESMGSEVTKEQLLFIHENKTAALIQAALMIGATLAGASSEDVAKMEKIGYNIGIAFQIQDDILDVVGTMEELGKLIGSDAKNEKATYVTLVGLDQAKLEVETLSKEAVSLLQQVANPNVFLEELVIDLISRNK